MNLRFILRYWTQMICILRYWTQNIMLLWAKKDVFSGERRKTHHFKCFENSYMWYDHH